MPRRLSGNGRGCLAAGDRLDMAAVGTLRAFAYRPTGNFQPIVALLALEFNFPGFGSVAGDIAHELFIFNCLIDGYDTLIQLAFACNQRVCLDPESRFTCF